MPRKVSRRELLAGGAALGAATIAPKAFGVPEIWIQGSFKPLIVCSPNGHQFKNGGTETCVERAFRLMTSGTDVLDALIEGVNILELDPKEMSIGYGGLPNADGVVQLDSCCMHGPRKWAGGVAALEGVRTPSRVAREVAAQTDHHLLVGKGAQEFARSLGFTIEADLNTDASRRAWLEWKRRTDPSHYLDPKDREHVGLLAALQMADEGWFDREHVYGTVNCNGMNAKGEICGVTTTSGLAFKIPGRVGDSPILGAGLYVDGAVGSAGSTGRGEANLYNLCSFFIVEQIRQGMHPKDAGIAALKRVASQTIEKRLLNDKGQPNFGLNFYALDAKGRFGGVSMQPSSFTVCDENGPRDMKTEALYG
ncbi:MAG TPA: N(4)-(beta-N-acetylglucosaminyl)-L-asparaginase [Fimbriimonadaceae bacterium]|nr:N(4)-(beta-N-acetylglucosaminyl)-L-asparaginase [Fimbriimonadaceae bacterium]